MGIVEEVCIAMQNVMKKTSAVCVWFRPPVTTGLLQVHEIPISSAQPLTSFHTRELSSTIPLVPPQEGAVFT